jgi:hypothetical protein
MTMSKSTDRPTSEANAKQPRAPGKSRRPAVQASHRVRQDKLLDEALEQTFPASDPLSSLRPAE